MLWMTRRSSCEHSLPSAYHQGSLSLPPACPGMLILTVHVLTSLRSILEALQFPLMNPLL